MEGSFYRDGDISASDEYRMKREHPERYRQMVEERELRREVSEAREERWRRESSDRQREAMGSDDSHIGPP